MGWLVAVILIVDANSCLCVAGGRERGRLAVFILIRSHAGTSVFMHKRARRLNNLGHVHNLW